MKKKTILFINRLLSQCEQLGNLSKVTAEPVCQAVQISIGRGEDWVGSRVSSTKPPQKYVVPLLAAGLEPCGRAGKHVCSVSTAHYVHYTW